ncbi:hypothetical protein MCHLDSM_03669 [Mycolicibacterium chlorophenolicum]|uniref:Uncharacterized protein n=1 Tax=Mycolicibacterium chlorophenolicum TaxID=37916 RepID=A0A0J6VZA1_9MYCO|nr:hypothetical protein MCHLDSM_03669 [Mycolicibacterium chlorophenolicum]
MIPFICISCGSVDIDSADCGQCATANGPEGAAA